jgi:glycosyltransferase involved in cell wall biosynthesis
METKHRKKLLVFHPIIAPYRIDLFNKLYKEFDTEIYIFQKNLLTQKFDYGNISKQFLFEPTYLLNYHKFLFIKIRKGLIKAINHFNPDIVLVPEYKLETLIISLYKIIFRKKFKVISIVDDSYDMIMNNNHFSKKHKYAESFILPLLDNIINIEPRVVTYFQRKYHKGIYFPIIQDENKLQTKYQKALPISEKYIEQYNLKDQKVVLFVGRLDKVKNLPTLIKVFKQVKASNCKLVIVGGGELENKLKIIADSNVIFTGRLEGYALYAWYNIAEIFVLASTREAFGAVTNEALIGGCFTLVSELAGSNCLINNGINGFTFNPYNEEEMIKTIKKSIEKTPLRTYPLVVRKNKMQYSFSEYVDSLIKNIK